MIGTLHGLPCCIVENYTFDSITDAFQNLTSNAVVIITRDIVLPSIETLENLNNITIIGQGNPTVNCDGTGAIQFISCNTVTIVGITWDRCGNSSKPGIEFSNSSNVALQTSSFCNSTGQTIVLSNVIGIVYINNCQFSQNDHYQKHGAALYYSKGIDNLHLKLTICNCTFSHNTAASLVYMNSIGKQNNYISIENSVFSYNQAVPVYISYNTLRR